MYPAKVLLYGEHTVLRGGHGLAVPYPRRSLRWAEGHKDELLVRFGEYLEITLGDEGFLNTNQLNQDLQAGAYLTGNIPTGYGLGSSGAVCAAFWDRYATAETKSLEGDELRAVFARMEAYFHGASSGTDPLICHLKQPVLLEGNSPRVVRLGKGWKRRFFLVDSGRARSAADLIRRFTGRYDGDPEFARAVDQQWRAPADAAIAALLAGDYQALNRHTLAINEFQRLELVRFIPAPLQDIWSGDGYVLKLCGAGGGGMMLGLLTEPSATTEINRTFERVEWL